MAPRRLVGWIALVAFAAVAASGAGGAPPPCCSPACDRCPVTICAAPAVEASLAKPAAAPSLLPGTGFLPSLDRDAIVFVERAPQMSRLPAHVFRRPMRN